MTNVYMIPFFIISSPFVFSADMGVYGKASKQANRFLFKLLHNKLVFFSRAFRMCAIIYGVWGWVGVRKDIDRIDLWDRELDFTMVIGMGVSDKYHSRYTCRR